MEDERLTTLPAYADVETWDPRTLKRANVNDWQVLESSILSCRLCPRGSRGGQAGGASRAPPRIGRRTTGASPCLASVTPLARPDRGSGAGRTWGQPHWPHVHRRQLGRFPVCGASPGRVCQSADLPRPRRRADADRCVRPRAAVRRRTTSRRRTSGRVPAFLAAEIALLRDIRMWSCWAGSCLTRRCGSALIGCSHFSRTLFAHNAASSLGDGLPTLAAPQIIPAARTRRPVPADGGDVQ